MRPIAAIHKKQKSDGIRHRQRHRHQWNCLRLSAQNENLFEKRRHLKLDSRHFVVKRKKCK